MLPTDVEISLFAQQAEINFTCKCLECSRKRIADCALWMRSLAEKELAEKDKEIERLKNEEEFLRKCMVRIASAAGIHTPEQLMCMAQNNEETYADILVREIERLHQARKDQHVANAIKEK